MLKSRNMRLVMTTTILQYCGSSLEYPKFAKYAYQPDFDPEQKPV